MHKVYDGVGHPEVGATSDPGFPAVFVEIDFSPLDFGIKVTSYAKSTSRATGKNPFTILVVKGQNEIREEGCLMRFIIQDVLPPDNRCCKRRYKGVTLTDIVLDVRVVKVFFLCLEYGMMEILDERLQLGNGVGCVGGRLRRRLVASC